MKQTLAIVGAGLAGRMLAIRLADDGWDVTLFDQGERDGLESCSYTGAGMLAPQSELDRADPHIAELGDRSIALWPSVLTRLPRPVDLVMDGTVLVAHSTDEPDLERMARRILDRSPSPERIRRLSAAELGDLEPDLATRFQHGWFIEREGHIDNRQLLEALEAGITHRSITWHTTHPCPSIRPHHVDTDHPHYDWVIDCRGLGAQGDLPDLRGVRGELLHLHAPEVSLRHPIRLTHPRYPLYVVPRTDNLFVIGATEIESDDRGPITVRSALELLTAAYSLHSGFAEAHIVEARADCRPAFPDNLPRVTCEPGLVRINGLYRHGFLLAPLLVETVCQTLAKSEAVSLLETNTLLETTRT